MDKPYHPSARLTRRVGRTIQLNLPDDGLQGPLSGEAVVFLDPEKGFVLRLKGRKREIHLGFDRFIELAEGDTVRKRAPMNRRFLQGQ